MSAAPTPPDHKLAERLADEIVSVPEHDRSNEDASILAEAYLDLQSRLEDAEMMLRAALVGDLVDRPAPSEDATVRLYAPDPATFGGRGLRTIYLKADDRGIPILTPESRAALKGRK